MVAVWKFAGAEQWEGEDLKCPKWWDAFHLVFASLFLRQGAGGSAHLLVRARCPQAVVLGCAEAGNPELRLRLPWGWQGPKLWSQLLPAHERELDPGPHGCSETSAVVCVPPVALDELGKAA